MSSEQSSHGARLAGWGGQRRRRLDTRLAVAEVVWAGSELVEAYVSLRHGCSASGHPLAQKVHEADHWIAATARWLDVPLVAQTYEVAVGAAGNSRPELQPPGSPALLVVELSPATAITYT